MKVTAVGELLSAQLGDKYVRGEFLFRDDYRSSVVSFYGPAGNGLDGLAEETPMSKVEFDGDVQVSKGQLTIRLLAWEPAAE